MDLPCLEDQKSCSYPFLRVLTAHFVPLPQSPDKILSIYSIDEKIDCLIRGAVQKNPGYIRCRLTIRVYLRAEGKAERRKKAERREKAEKADLVMQLAFWQTCRNAMK